MSKELYSDAGNGFNTVKEIDVVISDSTMTEVITMTTGDLPAGTYFIGYSFEYTLDTKDKLMTYRVGGTYGSLTEFNESVAAASVSLVKNRYYGFPKAHAGGPITLSMDFQVESGVVGELNFMDVFVSRLA